MKCVYCGAEFASVQALKQHNASQEASLPHCDAPYYPVREFRTRSNAWRGTEWMRLFGDMDLTSDFDGTLDEAFLLTEKLLTERGFKTRFNVQLHCELVKPTPEEEDDIHVWQYFSSRCRIPYTLEEYRELLPEIRQELHSQLEVFQSSGSGWSLVQILSSHINLSFYAPKQYGCYTQLPLALRNKRSLLNIETEGNDCFKWAVLASIFAPSDPTNVARPSQYRLHEHKYIFPESGPVTMKDISIFCRRNPTIALNVIEYDSAKRSFYPLRFEWEAKEYTVNLLAVNHHFFAIKNPNALLRKSAGGENWRAKFCLNCLNSFTNDTTLKNHQDRCKKHLPALLDMPPPETAHLTFNDGQNTILAPYFLVLDTEALLVADANERLLKRHELSSYAMILVQTADSSIQKTYKGFGPECAKQLVDDIKAALRFCDRRSLNLPIRMSQAEEISFQSTTHCEHCHREFSSTNIGKMRHHSHETGMYLGALCRACNFHARPIKDLPVLVHNLPYDICTFIRELYRLSSGGRSPFLIAESGEKIRYLKFPSSVVFADTFQYVSSSLEKLVEEHVQSGEAFPCLEAHFKDKASLLKQKGRFPYTYVDSWNAFDVAHLPSREHFDNDLTGEKCSVEDYNYAQGIFQAFDCKTLRDYSDIYLMSDVCLLADVLIAIRRSLYSHFQLDILRYVSLPHFSWHAALKKTGARVELFTDPNMYLFIEDSIRGGLVQQTVKFVQANNPALSNYNPEKPISHLLYYDVNSLYAYAMQQLLPVGEYSWSNVSLEELLSHPDDAPYGYVAEVDLDYPAAIHALTNDFPLAPNHAFVDRNDMSDFQRAQADKLGIAIGKVRKLLLTCKPQQNYIVHYRLLKFYVAMGMRATKLHKAIRFRQSAFLAPYIDYNTEQRRLAQTATLKTLFKLLNNSVFGRTLYNHRRTKSFSLALNGRAFDANARKLTVKHVKLLSNNVALFHHEKNEVKAAFPCIVGSAILDLSKLHVYTLFYTFKRHLTHVSLKYVDTDGFFLFSKSQNLFQELKTLKNDYLDCSNLSEGHPLFYPPLNAGIAGKLKDETAGAPISEAVFLRPKLYSLKYGINKESRRAKGVKKSVIARELHHKRFLETLLQSRELYVTQRSIQSRAFTNYTVETRRKALSCFDDKRKQLNLLQSVPYGYQGPPPLSDDYALFTDTSNTA